MAKKTDSRASAKYVCSSCEAEFSSWAGKCSSCGSWNSLEEVAQQTLQVTTDNAGLKSSAITPLRRAKTIASDQTERRLVTGIDELDRVLGGGFVEAEVVLFGGQPGSGKSTLSLSVAESFARQGKKVLYSSGEESEHQIGLRAQRMGVDTGGIFVVHETNLEALLGHIELEKPNLVIVDSLQTIASNAITGGVGSIAQGKEAAHILTRVAKANGINMLLINQMVKGESELAGSNQVAHIADCVLLLESDKETPLKFLRASKNRFGDASEVGIFQHTDTGLEEVGDPSGVLLESREGSVAGAACTFVSEGVRQIPVEVHALVVPSSLANPRKQFNGIIPQRGQIVCAILDKFCNAGLFENDAFVATVAGVNVRDPQCDLAIAASLLSSRTGRTIAPDTLFLGELSLTGYIRGGLMMERKLKEAKRLGFKRAVIPQRSREKLSAKGLGMDIIGMDSVAELGELLSRLS